MINQREIILNTLIEILEKKQYSHLVIRAVLDKYAYLPKQERGFIKRCCEGTIEQLLRIDYVIGQFSKTKINKMKPFIRTLLRMSAYQILCMDGVPDSAVCNEAVKLARRRGFAQLSGFVNGVLRSLSRGKAQIAYPEKGVNLEEYLSIWYSMPRWIVAMWIEQFGAEKTEEMLKGLLEARPVTIRMRETLPKAQRESVLERITQESMIWEQSPQLSYAYHLKHVDSVARIPGFAQGSFVVQDIGSMWVVETADIKEGCQVIDVCAAPGGKAIHAADKMNGSGNVLARDLSEYKVSMIQETIERCHVKNVSVQVWDATQPDDMLREKADVVIADLPCSGLGAIGRKGDIKYRVTQEDVAKLAALQREILKSVWGYVKKGGVLMFSTCTVTKQENEDNRDWIVKELPFSLAEEKVFYPGIDASDGFYMAKFIRNDA